jgi:hypothetical protein
MRLQTCLSALLATFAATVSASALTGNEPNFPKGAAMRYSDYPAFVACLREHPESSAHDRTRILYCIEKVVTDRVAREKNKVKP